MSPDQVTGEEPGGEEQFSFWITRIDGLSGSTVDQQVIAGQQLLAHSGLTDVKILRSAGSADLYVMRTTDEVSPEDLNQELARVAGYEYIRPAEGDDVTGAITEVVDGEIEINPLVSMISTRPDAGRPLTPPGGGPLTPPGPTILGNFKGLDANNNPFLLSPPDTIIAAGPNNIVEMTNLAIRVYAKDGTVLSTQFLDDFFGASSAGDPLIAYDDMAGRWYAAEISGSSNNQLLFAVSNTSNPLDGFTEKQTITMGPSGDLADFPKIGFNADAIVLEANDFGSGGGNPVLATIDKASVLDANPATLTVYNSTPAPNFRAMVPAFMRGASPGADLMYFVQERSFGDGDFVRVVQMTNVLSNSPVFTYTDIDVNNYGLVPAAAQPGGFVNANDTTFLNAEWRNGKLVAAHTVGDASDSDAHANWYLFDAPESAAATPTLLQEGRLDPGDGVSTYYPTVAINAGGAIGMTYMQSSPSQYASTVVTGRGAGDAPGTMRDGVVVAEGEDFLDGGFRAGDYSAVVVDPADGATFWGANEYKAVDAFWSTAIAHFSLGLAVSGTTPANGATVTTPPTQYTVDFSEAFDPAVIHVSGFTVNGHPATGYSVVDADTLSFTFTTNPVTAQGLQTIAVATGTVVALSDGTPVQAYSGTFRYDALRMQVVSTVPANGSVATLPLTSITVNLNEPYAPASVGTNDLALSVGSVTGFTLVNASTIKYTVAGITQEGTLAFTLSAGALTDVYGNPNLPYTASVNLDFGTVPFPVPTTSISPLGSLVYQTSMNGTIGTVGDTDSFTIRVDPGQTITVIVEPTDSSLRPTVSLSGPTGGGGATAAAAGQDAVIQTVRVPSQIYVAGDPKDYKVTVGGAGNTTGRYIVHLVLNAAAEAEDHDGATNDTRATAQSLDGSFLTLDTSNAAADRGAVVGDVRGGPQAGDVVVGNRSFNFFGGSVLRYDSAGNLAQTITSPVLDGGVISDVELGPNNVI